jgi:hypothetical protein
MICLFLLGLLRMMKCNCVGGSRHGPEVDREKSVNSVCNVTDRERNINGPTDCSSIHMYLHISDHESYEIPTRLCLNPLLAIIIKFYCYSDLAVTVVLLEECIMKQLSKRRNILYTILLLEIKSEGEYFSLYRESMNDKTNFIPASEWQSTSSSSC